MYPGDFTPKRATDLHAKLKKISKKKGNDSASTADVKAFNEALAEAKGKYANRAEVQGLSSVKDGITNDSLWQRAKQLMNILVALNIETALDAV